MRVLSVTTAVLAAANLAQAVQPIKVVGNKLFGSEDGKQFFLKGVAYQLTPDDPLVDTAQCKRDAELMEKLGVNSIRVYHVDPAADHDGCMSAFEDKGIYLLVDMDTFTTYILSDSPAWEQYQFANYSMVMDEFQKYDNTLAFFVGNENISQRQHSVVAPYLKAAARDMKAYRDAKGYRTIPVGYSAADIMELRPMLQDYLTCGGNSSEIVDFFALNSYSWCDPSDYTTSSYDKLEEYAKDFPVPMFFSETGCNQPGPRVWADQDAIFGANMTADWSGSIVYEWVWEQNKYGLVGYNPADPTVAVGGADATATDVFDGFLRKGTPTPVQPDFGNLQSKWSTNNPTGVASADYDPNGVSTRACPSSTAGGWWQIEGNVALPTLGQIFAQDAGFTSSPTVPTSAAPTSSGRATGTDDDGDSGSNGEEGVGSPTRHIAGMAAGLVGVMLMFTVWL